MPGATLEIGGAAELVMVAADSLLLQTGNTNIDGFYLFPNLPTGLYAVTL